MNIERENKIQKNEAAAPDPNKPGYSKAMLQRLNSKITLLSPASAIKAGNLRAIDEASRGTPDGKGIDRLRFESVTISARFVPQVWMRMMDWLKERGAALANINISNGELVALSSGDIRRLIGESPQPPENLVQRLTQKTTNFFVHTWAEELQAKAEDEKFRQTEEGRIFARYKQVITARGERRGDGGLTVEEHLSETIQSARSVVWDLFRTIPKVYDKGRPLGKLAYEEHKDIINNARTLVSSMAGMNPIVARTMFEILEEGRDISSDRSYDAKFFRFIEVSDGRKYLEFEPEFFEFLEEKLQAPEVQLAIPATLRCPALYVAGRDGRNLVLDFYDWNASLYIEYCVPKDEK